MDYKQKNVMPPQWKYDEFARRTKPEPFDQLTCANASELETPDRKATLLLYLSHLDEPGGRFTFYAIEAPRTCPVRKAFEWGELTWLDFWIHKPWLIEINYQIGGHDPLSRYIRPNEMNEQTVCYFDVLGHRGPYILKYEQIKGALKHLNSPGWDAEESIRNYRDFVLRHGDKLRDKFPKDFSNEIEIKLSP